MCTHTHIYTWYCTYAHIDMFKADIVLERQNPSPRVFSSSLHPSWDFSSCISRDSLWPTPLDSYGSRLGWTHPAQPVDNPYYPTPPSGDPLTSFLLSPHSLPFCSYLRLLLLPSAVREPPSAGPNPSPPPWNLPASFLLHACFSVAGSSTCLITSHPVARIVFFFPSFSLF